MNPLAIFTGPYALLAKWAVIGLLFVAAFGYGWIKGNGHGTQKLTDYVQAQAQEAQRIGAVRREVTERVVVKYVKQAEKTKDVAEKIETEVQAYAAAKPDNMCIDATWLRLHDSAAINAIPKPAPKPSGPMREAAADPWHAYGGASLIYRYPELRGAPSLR